MKPTTSIDVRGLQISLGPIEETNDGGLFARLSTNRPISPYGEEWFNKRISGRKGAGEGNTFTAMRGERVAVVEFAKGTTRAAAEAAVGRFLDNVWNAFPDDPDKTAKFFGQLGSEALSEAMAAHSDVKVWGGVN